MYVINLIQHNIYLFFFLFKVYFYFFNFRLVLSIGLYYQLCPKVITLSGDHCILGLLIGVCRKNKER
jgi:hypothetical protein